jgi:hypothetical protein
MGTFGEGRPETTIDAPTNDGAETMSWKFWKRQPEITNFELTTHVRLGYLHHMVYVLFTELTDEQRQRIKARIRVRLSRMGETEAPAGFTPEATQAYRNGVAGFFHILLSRDPDEQDLKIGLGPSWYP